jgi:hypothetical protein
VLRVFSSYCTLAGGQRGPTTAAITGLGVVTSMYIFIKLSLFFIKASLIRYICYLQLAVLIAATNTPSDSPSNSLKLGIPSEACIKGGIGVLILVIILLY